MFKANSSSKMEQGRGDREAVGLESTNGEGHISPNLRGENGDERVPAKSIQVDISSHSAASKSNEQKGSRIK